MTNAATLHSFNRVRNLLGTSIDNVRRYMAFLEEAQLVFSLQKFSYKASESQRGNRKVYVADTGLRNTISFRFSRDLGRLIENVVAAHLLPRSRELFYFGNGSECDFIFRQSRQYFPLQVSYSDLSDAKTKHREIQGLKAAMQYLNRDEGLLLTDEMEREERVEGLRIRLQPVWKFLLSV